MKNKTIKNLIAFGTLAILLVSAHSALAYVPYTYDMYAPPQPSYYVNPQFTELPTWTPTQPHTANSNGVVHTTTAYPTIVEQPAPTPVKTVSTTTTKKTVVATNTNKSTATSNTVYSDQQNPNYPYGYYDNSNQLTALSLKGSGSFMPSSIWQWLIVIFLILVIIIIARMLGRGNTTHHEVHTVHH